MRFLLRKFKRNTLIPPTLPQSSFAVMLRSKHSCPVLDSGKYPADEYLRHAKFIFEAWKHPQTLAIMSKIAGVELVPVMDYEIGHINISVPGQKRKDDNNVPSDED